ncbi:unnamed protein product [Dicrocoelium dendriticum]|nr:unnamed protein product [Dicrocoelium dendriticum]
MHEPTLCHSVIAFFLTSIRSSEAADGLNRGGCEGLLHAARSLLCSTFVNSYTDSLVVHDRSPPLLRYITSVSISFSAGLHASSLVVCLALTLEPQLASQVLVRLCCAASASPESGSNGVGEIPDNPISALSLFFPLLEELEAGWLARTSSHKQATCAAHWAEAFSSFPSSSYSHRLLAHEFLPSIFELLMNEKSSDTQLTKRVLRALVWLIYKEQNLNSRQRLGPPQLVLALAIHLIPMLKLMSTITDTQSCSLLLTLLDAASALYIETSPPFKRCAPRSVSPGARCPPEHRCTLSTSQCLSAGKYLVGLWHKMLAALSSIDASSCEVMAKLKLLDRIEGLLVSLSTKYPILRCTILRFLPDASLTIAMAKSTVNDVMPSIYSKIKTRSFDWRTLHSPSFLPDFMLQSPSDVGNGCRDNCEQLLLLASPPPDDGLVSQVNGDNLARGQLRRPMNTDLSGNLKKQTVGAGSDAVAIQSATTDASADCNQLSGDLSGCQPIYFHWLRLIDRLVYAAPSPSFCSPESTGRVLSTQAQLGVRLEHYLLPHGLCIPQTSITHLPNPPALVLPPSGIGLERVIELVHTFCPEVKALATSLPSDQLHRASLPNLSTPMAILLLRALDVRRNAMMLDTSKQESVTPPMDNSLDSPDQFNEEYQLLLPCPKLVLGLLMGLEATWAGPLAPRIPISDSIRYLEANDGRYAQGIFPVKSSRDVYFSLARRLSVDYGQRRVDCRSALFRLTQDLLLLLADSCYRQDYCAMKKQLASLGEEMDGVSPPDRVHFPLDRLLRCLTPREMAIVLSDIRRNLRLRIAFAWVGENRHHSPGSVSDSVLSLITADRLPPPPAFITPGLLLAILHAHLMERGVADIVGPLLQGVTLLHRLSPPMEQSVTPADAMLEEVDVDGELMVVVND